MLTQPKRARERILLIGGFGCGKSQAWTQLAYWLRQTKAPSIVYVVDTDHAADRLGSDYDKFFLEEGGNVEAFDVWDYEEALKALKDARQKADKNDILVVDLADKLWGWAQDHYISEMFGKDALTFYTEAKEKGGVGHPLAGEQGTNWQLINKHYAAMITEVQRFPGHVIFCTPAVPVAQPNAQGKGGDDKEVRNIFGRFGVRPGGQKSMGFQFFSVLWMLNPKEGEWSITTIKDLKRTYLVNQKVDDFVMDYLVGVAGWVLDG